MLARLSLDQRLQPLLEALAPKLLRVPTNRERIPMVDPTASDRDRKRRRRLLIKETARLTLDDGLTYATRRVCDHRAARGHRFDGLDTGIFISSGDIGLAAFV